MKEVEREKTREFLVDWTRCWVFCFSEETPTRWKEIFMNKRLDMFLETQKEMFEETTGIQLNERNEKEFRAIYKEMFMEEVERYLTELKKAKDTELREKIKREGCVRKVDNSEGKVKRKRKK